MVICNNNNNNDNNINIIFFDVISRKSSLCGLIDIAAQYE